MLDAHYTSLPVVDAMWSAVKRLGFDGGRIVEPAMGTGNFFGRMPPEIGARSALNGVEKDHITGAIARQLYQRASIAVNGFEDVVYPANSADLVIGNPPFGSQTLYDATMPTATRGFSIHNFFFAKAVEIARPGGLISMVVSHNLMDQRDATARRWIAERAHLLGAVRLPYTAFLSNAGTEVVTDILFLQKAMPGETPDAGWTQTKDITLRAKDGTEHAFQTSAWFHDHPEMVLGTQEATGKMYGRPDQYNVAPWHDGGELGSLIVDTVQRFLPEGVYAKPDHPVDVAAARDAMVPEHVKVYGYFVDGDTVMQRVEDSFDGKQQSVPVAFKDKTSPKRATGMIGVRDALRDLMRAEMTADVGQTKLNTLRKALNERYDGFVKQFGFINAQTNRRALKDDPDLPLLESLEPGYDPGISKEVAKRREVDPKPARAGKADIFKKRVLSPTAEVTSVSSAKDALVASLNAHGAVYPDYMAKLYGKDFDTIVAELGDLVYQNPDSRQWEPSDAYLSGNVKDKLAKAKAAAAKDQRYARNVTALESVQPADVPALKIGVRLGSPWVPGSAVEDFARGLLGSNARVKAQFVRAVGRWSVDVSGADQAASISRWGTARVPAAEVMAAVMNNKQILVRDNHGTRDHPMWVVNEPETEAARARAEEMGTKFKEWIWQDETRRINLERLYNDGYNTDRRRQYDGEHLTLPGSSPAVSLRQHQKSGVWRGIQEQNLLLDHVVGAGKTYEMAAIALELRRLGISRKPTFAVPNHLVRQWRDEIYKLYPNANVLAATEADFERKNRKRLFARIATGDWDAVIVGHSSFQKIGAPRSAEQEILKEQLDEISEAIESVKNDRGDRNVLRDMERIKQNLAARMKQLNDAAGKKDDVVDFGELGIDALFVDEAHLFKNLFYMSQMRGIAGMGSPAGSGRAFDLFVKTQFLRRQYGKQARIVFATGTPVSNSLVEMYTMQRYLAWDELKRRGIATLDAWAGVYGDVQNVYEVHPSGTGYRLKTRFAKFVNLPSLMELYRGVADVVSLDDLKDQARAVKDADGKPGRFPVPKVKGGRPRNVVAERSDTQVNFFGVPEFARDADGQIVFKYPADLHPALDADGKWILVGSPSYVSKGETKWARHAGPFESEVEAKEQADALIRQPVVGYNKDSILWKFENLKTLNKASNGKINALSVTNEARKAGLDYRLVDPAAPDFEGSKINLAAAEIARIHTEWSADRGTQLVFCDLSTPKSARAAAATKEKPAYVRDRNGAIRRVKATVAAVDGQPVAFLVVKEKPGAFVVHDGLTGAELPVHGTTREEAVSALKSKLAGGSYWVDNARQRFDEIDDDAIAEWKAQQDTDEDASTEEGDDGITVGDLMAMGGSGARFSVYDDLKAKLIASGIPEREIAFIHDYDTAAKKSELFRAVKAGDIRILLGSTEKMGAGTNVQERLVALHHLDAPWRPSDLEQREGRIIRQGNALYERDPEGFEVELFRYATRQTYDTRMWQIIEHKAAGIEQLRKADATTFEIEDVGGEEANAADMKAAASGNPLILDEIRLRNEVKSLEAQQYAHQSGLINLQDRLRRARGMRARVEDEIADFKPVMDAAKANPPDPFAFRVGKKTYDDRKDAATAAAVMSAFQEAAQQRREGSTVTAGEYRGTEVVFRRAIFGVQVQLVSGDGAIIATDYTKADTFSPSGLFTRIDNALSSLPARQRELLREADNAEAEIPGLEKEVSRPFAKADDLTKRRGDHRKVMNQLAKAGGGVELTPAMRKELNSAIRARLGDGAVVDEEGPRFSAAVRARASASIPTTLTAAAARAVAEQAMGKAGIDNLTRRGILKFVDSVSDMPSALQDFVRQHEANNAGSKVVAVADHTPGSSVYLIASRTSTADVPGLVMHEIGEHFGLRDMVGDRNYLRLMNEVRLLGRAGKNPALKAAWDHVAAHYQSLPQTSDEFASEVLARLSETEGFRQHSLWKRLMSQVRQFLFRIGLTRAWRLTDADLGQMVAASLRRTMQQGTATPTLAGEVAPISSATASGEAVQSSPLYRVLDQALPRKGGAAIYRSMIASMRRRGEIDADALDASGLVEWLGQRGRELGKTQVLEFLLTGDGPQSPRRAQAAAQSGETTGAGTASAPNTAPSAAGPSATASPAGTVTPAGPQQALPMRYAPDIGLSVETQVQQAQRKIQDKFNRMQQAQQSLTQAGRTVTDAMDVYGKEQLFYGRVDALLKAMELKHVTPLANAMAREKVSIDELDKFLYAKHAPEANAYIASINPEMQDGGSGMSTQAAVDYLSTLGPDRRAVLDVLASRVHAMNEDKLKLMERVGLVDPRQIALWRNQYQFYVPLKSDIDPNASGTGMGYDIRGPESKRRMGRQSEASSPMMNSIRDFQRTIIRAGKAEIGQSLYELVRAFPDVKSADGKPLWEIKTPADFQTRRLVESTTTNPITGQKTTVREVEWGHDPMFRRADNVFSLKRGGKEVWIQINDEVLAQQLKNLGDQHMPELLRVMAMGTRVLASLHTGLNPEFWVTNFSRDVQTALIHIQDLNDRGVAAKGIARAVAGDVFKRGTSLLPALYLSENDVSAKAPKRQEWQNWIRDYERAGGKIGFFGLKSVDAIAKDLEKSIRRAGDEVSVLSRGWTALIDTVEAANAAIENALRVSLYRRLVESGVSKHKAALAARNLTVNFNKRGEWSGNIGAFFMFFNAAVQGTARMVKALRYSKSVRYVAAGYVVAGIMAALWNELIGGDDDDKDEKKHAQYSDWQKNTNLLLLSPDGDEAAKVPLPYGYNLFYVTGYRAVESVLNPDAGLGSFIGNVAGAAAGAFDPIGITEGIGQAISKDDWRSAIPTFTPSIARPLMEVAVNRNFMGNFIWQEDWFRDDVRPDSERAWVRTPEVYKAIARALNEVTGGDKHISGTISISPETLQHLWTAYIGGTGRVLGDTVQLAAGAVQGKSPESFNDFPFLRKVAGEPYPGYTTGRFHAVRESLLPIRNKIADRETQEDEWRSADQRWGEAIREMKIADRNLPKLRRRLNVADTDEERGEIEQLIADEMNSVIKAYNAAKRETPRVTAEEAKGVMP